MIQHGYAEISTAFRLSQPVAIQGSAESGELLELLTRVRGLAKLHRCWDVKVYDVAQMGRLAFLSLFMGMDILTKEGRIPSELVPLAIAWGQGVAAEIEALFCPEEREEPPEGGPAQM